MIKKSFFHIVIFQCLTVSALANANSLLHPTNQQTNIFINNRILGKINGKAVSVIDVMKKMDMLFFREFPQYASSVEARYQFYQMHWKNILEELIDKELIVADAEENKMAINSGDIRQEMESLFGPNIISNLDKAGLTYDDARKMIKEDLTIQRMLSMRVNSKVIRTVTPKDIRDAYAEYARQNIQPDAWKYQVISMRGKDPTLCAEAMNYAYQLLVHENLSIQELEEKLQERSFIGGKASFTISEEYQRTENEVSEAYKKVLSVLEKGSFSKPVAHKSRADNSTVFRIFYLSEMMPGGIPPFNTVENKLKNMLLDKAMNKESEQYIAKLRQHFDIRNDLTHQMFSDDFQPFTLK